MRGDLAIGGGRPLFYLEAGTPSTFTTDSPFHYLPHPFFLPHSGKLYQLDDM